MGTKDRGPGAREHQPGEEEPCEEGSSAEGGHWHTLAWTSSPAPPAYGAS